MRTKFAAAGLLLALAGCGHGGTPVAAGASVSASTSGFPDCEAVFKDGQPAPAAPAADRPGVDCAVSKGVIVAVAGIRCKDDSFLWSSHEKGAEGWGVAGQAWHAGEYHVEDRGYSAALGSCLG
jgi:hypothetical protein